MRAEQGKKKRAGSVGDWCGKYKYLDLKKGLGTYGMTSKVESAAAAAAGLGGNFRKKGGEIINKKYLENKSRACRERGCSMIEKG